MSIVSSSHTPQGRGEEKGANYKWPHPVLPDFSSSGIGPRFISAQAALWHDPPRLPGAPRCREVRGEAARSRPRAGRGPGPPAVLPWPLPGAPRLPSPGATEPGLPRYRQQPRAALTDAGLRAQVRSGPGVRGREGHREKNRCRLHGRSKLPSNGGWGARRLCLEGFRERSVPRHPP